MVAARPTTDNLPSAPRAHRHVLEARFLGKDEVIRLLLIAVVAGEHAVLVGPPGTAKSALIRTFARAHPRALLRVPAHALHRAERDLRPGRHRRVPRGRLPAPHRGHAARGGDRLPRRGLQVELAPSSTRCSRSSTSARYTSGGAGPQVPAPRVLRRLQRGARATRRWPRSSTASSSACARDNLDAYHFQELLQSGIAARDPADDRTRRRSPLVARARARRAAARRSRSGCSSREEFLSPYKGLVFQIRAEGVSLSDRRVVKLLKLFAASALPRRARAARRERLLRPQAHLEQPGPGGDPRGDRARRCSRRTTASTRTRGASAPLGVGIEALAGEIDRIRQVLTGGGGARRRAALQPAQGAQRDQGGARRVARSARARARVARVDQLLEAAFRSGRFAQL